MKELRCPRCGTQIGVRAKGPVTVIHSECPKRGQREAAPVYQEITT